MADVSIAVDDPLLDPFINPAKGAIHEGLILFMSRFGVIPGQMLRILWRQ
jgi:hypothetical protein